MSSDIAINVANISKSFHAYKKPHDRLLQAIFRGKKKYYEEFNILNDISFQVKKGETLGIVGVNGAGKSTLLQIICGTLTPTNGEVEINGRVAALLELGAGFNPDFTGVENIKLSGQIYGLSEQEINNKLEDIIKFSGIGDYVYQEVKTYSSGMFVRLAFSVIAHLNPQILIVDEALAVGDFIFQQKCALYMKETLAGVTKILVSHDLSSIASMADRVLVLNKGKVVFLGEPQRGLAVYQKVARAAAENIEPELIVSTENTKNNCEEWISIDKSLQSGTGRAFIPSVRWSAGSLELGKTIEKNENLSINFIIDVKESIDYPIVGYQVQDRFGNAVFGENTSSSSFPINSLTPGEYHIHMEIIWPQIAPGEYGVTIGIGNGFDSTSHVVECWAHNVIVLGSVQVDPVHGIFNKNIDVFEISKVS